MDLVRSALLAAWPHGFTTRAGGASPPPWDALNLGGAVGDDPARVAENWRRLEAATGLGFARVRQVHGARAVRLDAPCAPAEEADAVVSLRAGVAACVSVADCVPVLLADPDGGAVAAVHAGWRGTLAGAAGEGVRALCREAGARPERLLAAIGPSIGPCCYEVSPELAARFAAALGPGVVRDGPAPHLDLWEANRAVLLEAGVRPERVDRLDRCTACEPARFFSHRRDAGRTGRQIAFIAPPGPMPGTAPLP
ncbi:peptidoglycan editing factor PgeF [Anaeromyxobacter sp. PSR-1]|uniref:peptidoglycan editing factor PgeF n=1 Tax=Anaeromyxobacter sp. PSR-1 TaxID=1300915 RepID=UPI0005E5F59A|nr:peptidoglycan editing factor PgeF [Anaeromyxobacter sp. PSR-1]GAO04262.1 laccase domain protein [Anaeromyxobacter sp. PSR-1]